MATRHTTTASNSTNLWLKPPYLITCDEAVVAVHVFEQSELKLLCKFALKAYLQSGKLRESGRGANALHGVVNVLSKAIDAPGAIGLELGLGLGLPLGLTLGLPATA
mgnify:CR=1 FL=1